MTAFESRSSGDRKSTRLNSSHLVISYAVFCLKKNIAGQVSWRLKTSRRFAASHPEEQTVKRECAGTSHHNRQGESQHQKVVLNAFARLSAEPVHEESVLRVHHGDRDDHSAGDPQSSDPAE